MVVECGFGLSDRWYGRRQELVAKVFFIKSCSLMGKTRFDQTAFSTRTTLFVASLLDLAGTKVAVIQQRAENKDYLDIDALLQYGITLPTALAAGKIVYGHRFNPIITLKALSYFDDLPTLPAEVKTRLSAAAAEVDLNRLPDLSAYPTRHPHDGLQP